MALWKRYFLWELIKVFTLFIGCFYFLYILIDYSTHAKVFQGDHISCFAIGQYYLFQFTKRADILVPIALLIGTIKVLTTANVYHEIVALTTGGISLKKILRPFFLIAFLCSTFLYLNVQYLQPFSLSRIEAFEKMNFKDKGGSVEKKEVNALVLQDHSLLIYRHYANQEEAFFDVFWLKSFDEIYRIQSLFPFGKIPLGRYVDTLSRQSDGEIVKVASHQETHFPTMQFDKKALFSVVYPPRQQALTQLAKHFNWQNTLFGMTKMSDREAEVGTFFFHKLFLPLICFLAVMGPAPYCLRFGRHLPVFLIYALSLFGMISFFTLVNSSVILGASQVIPPLVAMLLPYALFSLVVGWKYVKI